MTNYLYHLEKVFNLISDCENNGRNIDSLLENPISQKGFSRLN